VNAPAVRTPRIAHLDLLRGVATLGILLMNALSFGLVEPAYFRLDAAGWGWPTDRIIGVAGEVFVDQKMMGLFSLLFGASLVLFVDRVGARRRHPVLLSLWRNTLLLGIGLVHTWLWEGDILTVYALCAPVVLGLRKLPTKALYTIAGLCFAATIGAALLAQAEVNQAGAASLGWYWIAEDLPASDAVDLFVVFDAFARAVGLMLIGVVFQRSGLLAGRRPTATYRRMAVVGLVLGLPLAIAGVAWQLTDAFSPRTALSSGALNTVATVPMTIAFTGLLMLWSLRPARGKHRRRGRGDPPRRPPGVGEPEHLVLRPRVVRPPATRLTRSTPARLYQERSNSTISPAAGWCAT